MTSRRSNHDAKCLLHTGKNRNLIVPWWLMSSYLYYCREGSILSDEVFDGLCKRLDAEWDWIEHRHKYLIDRKLTKSAFYIPESSYPTIVKDAAMLLFNQLETK